MEKRYRIITVMHNEFIDTTRCVEALQDRVNKAVVMEGWQPLGGMSVESWEHGANFHQTLYKPES